jgi:hypothetical protein
VGVPVSIPLKDPNFTMSDLQKVGEEFLEAGQRYWEAAHKAGISGAVIWLSVDGATCIYTRGEYRDVLLRNVDYMGPAVSFGAAKDDE